MSRKLFIAIPCYREMDALFAQCLMRLINRPPDLEFALRMNIGDSLVSRARNSLTADFLASDCTDLLFIDSDLLFSAEHVERIAAHDVDVVGGLYPKKQEGPLAWVLNACADSEVRPDGLQRVSYIGTGFLRVSRRVFEQMAARYDMGYKPDQSQRPLEHDFWAVGTYRYRDGSTRYLSEDWFFCQRWLDLGGQVWADGKIVLRHVGTAVYPLQTQEPEIFAAPTRAAEDGATVAKSPPPPGA